jgi:hypothetical protein
MKLIKHIGKLKDLDTRVLVVFMQIQDRKDHALVVATHTLPDVVQDELKTLVESDECQQENDLGTFLNRKTLPNSNGGSILSWLHNSGKLIAVPVEAVIMTPHPGYPTPLAEVLKLMESARVDKLVDAKTDEDKTAVANNLLIEATMLREEADKKESIAVKLLSSVDKKEKAKSKKKSEEAN